MFTAKLPLKVRLYFIIQFLNVFDTRLKCSKYKIHAKTGTFWAVF